MNQKYYYLQKKVLEGLNMKYGYFSLPEMGLTFLGKSVEEVSEALYPLMKDCVNKIKLTFPEKTFDEERISSIYEIIKNQVSDKIIYISLIGEEAKEAYFYFEKKFSQAIVKNAYHEPIIKEEEIYIPIKLNSVDEEILRKLSFMNVTVSLNYGHEKSVFFLGEKRVNVKTDLLTFIAFITSRGFFIDEYLLAEILYHMSYKSFELVNKILKNINCKFTKSLIKMHEYEFLTKNPEKVKDKAQKIADLLYKIDFDLIKDKDFEFVEVYC